MRLKTPLSLLRHHTKAVMARQAGAEDPVQCAIEGGCLGLAQAPPTVKMFV